MLPVQTSRTVSAGSGGWAGTRTVCRSVRTRTAQDGPHGLPEDHQVEGEGPVLDVADVDAYRLVPGEVGASADLPQAGDAGLDQQPTCHVEAVLLDLARDVRARADQAHAAAEHVEQLGQLVERVAPHEGADA